MKSAARLSSVETRLKRALGSPSAEAAFVLQVDLNGVVITEDRSSLCPSLLTGFWYDSRFAVGDALIAEVDADTE
ncbi:MAG: hypothetical protein AAFV53_16365 [Myxococcota bacterium]